MQDIRRTALILTALFACDAAAAQTAPATSQVEVGRQVYVSKGCYQCHGSTGQGSIATGVKLVPTRLSPEAFTSYVRKPVGSMPSYSAKLLPDTEVGAILAYLNSLPRPADAATIPLLAPYVGAQPRPAPQNRRSVAAAPSVPARTSAAVTKVAARGKPGSALYAQHCAVCHGSQRQGGVGASLVDEANRRTLEQTKALLRNPPAGMPKLFPTPLGENEVREIATFIRTPR